MKLARSLNRNAGHFEIISSPTRREIVTRQLIGNGRLYSYSSSGVGETSSSAFIGTQVGTGLSLEPGPCHGQTPRHEDTSGSARSSVKIFPTFSKTTPPREALKISKNRSLSYGLVDRPEQLLRSVLFLYNLFLLEVFLIEPDL